MFAHFKKPEMRFVGEMLYGIQASGSTMPGSIVREIDDDVNPIMTEKRLSRNPASPAIGGEGTVVYDRGGDRSAFFEHFIEKG